MLDLIVGIIICSIFLVACQGAILIVRDKQKAWKFRNRGDKR